MKRLVHLTAAITGLALAGGVGCHKQHHEHAKGMDHAVKAEHMDASTAKMAVAKVGPSKAATTQPTMNNVTGTITFTQVADGVAVTAEISGLPSGTTHGFHIHEKGDLSAPDLMSTGPHWDPMSTHVHGAPSTSPVHGGDMGNLKADSNGVAKLSITLRGLTIDGTNGVVGHAVIIHANADDLSSQPSGNAGGRIAGGLIEAQK